MALLEVKNLCTEFKTDQGRVQAVRNVSFELGEKEVLGIVGESGSGKSQTMYSIIGLLAENGVIADGKVIFDGKDISRNQFATKKEYEEMMAGIRGNSMAMIFQDPMTFLNPVLKIETQLVEPLLNHTNMTKEEARERALELMRLVGIPSPEKRITQYPFEFSGGMRQRIVIAIALACNPKLIIADEPTTALDVTIQAQVLELIEKLRNEADSSIIMITHDLGVVAKLCDRIAIMYGGKIVEIGTDKEIFYNPKHPYTHGLLSCIANPENDDEEELTPIPGSPPDLLNPPVGCPFVDRCTKAMKVCKLYPPEVTTFSDTHQCACWLNQKEAMNK
ncbi:MAG: ABC transporter ATP-binding protein [Erysipelotrichaceae bacterium]|nr:ABC transporter ATP-binding protein [Erysipelotrichaceae bacterium]